MGAHTTHFEFTDDGCLGSFTAVGAFMHEEKQRLIEDLIRDHSAISRDAIGKALQTSGARFGPLNESESRTRIADTVNRLRVVVEGATVASVQWEQDDTAQWFVSLVARCHGKAATYNCAF
jgi:hypothetical protein